MKPKQTRWHCPNGCAALMGPTKPRADDTRRYCLPCSAATGRLVRRTAPTLDRKREQRATTHNEKALARRLVLAAKDTAHFTIAGLDVRALVVEFCRAPSLSSNTPGMAGIVRANMVGIKIRRCKSMPRSRLGFARYSTFTITIFDYPGITPADLRETVLHELAHLRVGRTRDGGGGSHGTKWRTVFRLACEQTLGIRPRLDVCYHGEVTRKLGELDATGAGAER